MTAIVAVRKGRRLAIATDSLTTFGNKHMTGKNHRSIKIRRVGDSYIALTGFTLYKNILDDYLQDRKTVKLNDQKSIYRFTLKFWKELKENYSFVNDQSGGKYQPFADLSSSFMVLNKNGIFAVDSKMSVTQFKQYYAIGSGASYCLGALHALYKKDKKAKEIAREAIAASIAFDPYCGGRIRVREIKRKRKK